MSASKKAKPARSGAGASSEPLPAAQYKPINDVWWCAIHPTLGYAHWDYIGVTKATVAELLTREEGKYWAERGWRIAKLQVTEV